MDHEHGITNEGTVLSKNLAFDATVARHGEDGNMTRMTPKPKNSYVRLLTCAATSNSTVFSVAELVHSG